MRRPSALLPVAWILCACGPQVAKIEVVSDVVVFDPTTASLTVTLRDDQGHPLPSATISWHSSDARVAEIDERSARRLTDGSLVYRIEIGDSGLAWLTAKAGAQIADVRVRVAIPQSVEVAPPAVRLPTVGLTQRLQVVVRDDHSQSLAGAPVWFRTTGSGQTDPTAPRVFSAEEDDGGILVTSRALGHGALMVYSGATAPADGGSDPKGSFWTTVMVDVAPVRSQPEALKPAETKLAISPATLTLKAGKSGELKLRFGDSVPKGRIAWRSLSPKIAAVNPAGKIKAKRRGTAEIDASIGHQTARALVIVK